MGPTWTPGEPQKTVKEEMVMTWNESKPNWSRVANAADKGTKTTRFPESKVKD